MNNCSAENWWWGVMCEAQDYGSLCPKACSKASCIDWEQVKRGAGYKIKRYAEPSELTALESAIVRARCRLIVTFCDQLMGAFEYSPKPMKRNGDLNKQFHSMLIHGFREEIEITIAKNIHSQDVSNVV